MGFSRLLRNGLGTPAPRLSASTKIMSFVSALTYRQRRFLTPFKPLREVRSVTRVAATATVSNPMCTKPMRNSLSIYIYIYIYMQYIYAIYTFYIYVPIDSIYTYTYIYICNIYIYIHIIHIIYTWQSYPA